MPSSPKHSEISHGLVLLAGSEIGSVSSELLGFYHYPYPGTLSDLTYIADEIDEYSGTGFPGSFSIMGPEILGTMVRNEPLDIFPFAVSGVVTPSYMDDYYYRVHIQPNPIDFGSVLSAQTRSIEVWNAWTKPMVLNSITSDGDIGVSLSGPEAPVTTFNAIELRYYTLTVELEGPANLDAGFTFNFAEQVTRLGLTGTRVFVFPIPPNWKVPVMERLEWLTDVLEKRDGSEQRLRLRQNPRQVMEYETLTHGGTTNLLGSLLFGWQGRTWAVPAWFHAQQLSTAVAAGTTSITCPTAGREFQVGNYVILYLSEHLYETGQVATIGPNEVTVEIPFASNWPSGTWVMPIRMSRIKDDITVRHINGEVATSILRFYSEGPLETPPAAPWPAFYEGLPVLEVEPNRTTAMSEVWSRRLTTIDHGFGRSTITDKLPFSRSTRSHEFFALNRDKARIYRDVMFYAQGRWKEFWSPTFNQDMIVAEDIIEDQDWLVIKHMQYAKLVRNHSLRGYIRLALRTGQVYYRQIVDSDDANTPNGTEKLFLDSPIPVASPASTIFISFMSVARMDSDAAEFHWHTPAVVDTTAQIKGVLA